jgi:hypothetical protein
VARVFASDKIGFLQHTHGAESDVLQIANGGGHNIQRSFSCVFGHTAVWLRRSSIAAISKNLTHAYVGAFAMSLHAPVSDGLLDLK